MPPVDRNDPKRCASSDSRVSLMEFMREFPDDAACLEWLWRERWSDDGTHADCPKCKRHRAFKRYATSQRRQSWTCTGCGHHVHPTAGTIFHKSSTSLHLWFYAFYLMTSTRCGISAKHLEREIGVNYKTAWRMLNKIRNELMADDGETLSGDVEVDETYVGGRWKGRRGRPGEGDSKSPVLGMVERGGRVVAKTVPNVSRTVVMPHIEDASSLAPQSSRTNGRSTTRWPSAAGPIAASATARRSTSWATYTRTPSRGSSGLVKNGIRGTYHAVSKRWLQGYLNEYAWRYNHRSDERAQFRSLLLRSARG